MTTSPLGPYKPITYGKDYNYYKEVSISSSVFGADTAPDGYSIVDGYDCNAFVWFPIAGLIFVNKSSGASKVIQYSFNGTTVHGELDANDTATRTLTFYHRKVSKIWFRVKSGSSGPVTITVQAWATG